MIENRKCELCSMDATHNESDTNGLDHFYCEHHSLQSVKKKAVNKYRKLLPLFYIFIFILSFSFIRQFIFGFDLMLYMMDFMGVFFLVFGLFKLIDLGGFVVGFQQYDFIAKKNMIYGYAYPFIEITLGIMYLMGLMYLGQNLLALFLSTVGIYTAYKHIGDAEEIQCVCLGTVFKLPMTWVTLFENLLMFVMVLFMLAM